MINPLRCIMLNEQYYNIVDSSFKEQMPLKTTISNTQAGRKASVLGSANEIFTVTLVLDNSFELVVGSSVTGTTSWLGVSQLAFVKSGLGAKGVSMPVTFVTPYGATYSVVPTGVLDNTIFNSQAPQSSGTEFRISLTMEVVT